MATRKRFTLKLKFLKTDGTIGLLPFLALAAGILVVSLFFAISRGSDASNASLGSMSSEVEVCSGLTDVHYHLSPGDILPITVKGMQKRLEGYSSQIERALSGNYKKIFFLTPSYLFDGGMSKEEIVEENRLISVLLQKYDRAYGLCGINFRRPEAEYLASECLKLPKIIGFKLRGLDSSRSHLDIFRKIVEIADERRAVVLSHFTYGDFYLQFSDKLHVGMREEAKKIIDIMEANPHARLIVAHSGVPSIIGFEGMDEIAKSNSVRNIFIETSGFMHEDIRTNDIPNRANSALVSQVVSEYVQVWKKVGMDRILFGSDMGFTDDPFLDFIMPQCEQLNAFEQLSTSEKSLIFSENSRALLDSFLKAE